MRNGFLILLLALGFSVSSLAGDGTQVLATSINTVQKQNWDKLIDIVQKKGHVLESAYGDYLFLQQIEPSDVTQAHVANYFSLVGGRDAAGQFNFGRIEVVSEDWQINQDGHWVIDQYLYRISPEGEIISGGHVEMIQTKDRIVLKHEFVELGENAVKSNWQRILNNWFVHVGLD